MSNPVNFNQFTITQINDKDKEALKAYKFVFVPNKSYLNDSRMLAEFKQITLGGYKRTEAFSLLDKAISSAKIEHACYWAYQLLASGQASVLWERLMSLVYKNINIGNPTVPGWILNKDIAWYRLISMKEYAKDGILLLRNNQLARNLITELVVMQCLSRKRKLDSLTLKIKDTDFIIANFHARCQVRNNIMIAGLLGPNDPSEIRIAANEFCYNLVNKQIQETMYWLNWILYWEKINVKKYKTFFIQSRAIDGIQAIDQRDVIWLVWSIIQQVKSKLLQAQRVNNVAGTELLEANCDSLWNLYLHKWKPAAKSRKLPIIYWMIHMLVYPCDWSIPVIERFDVFIKACANTNLMFEKIVGQCKFGNEYTLAGPTLLDMKDEQINMATSITPITEKYGAKIMGDIGANSGLNVIIEDNYKRPESLDRDEPDEDEPLTNSRGAKQKKGDKSSALTSSMNKLSIVNQLDAYLMT